MAKKQAEGTPATRQLLSAGIDYVPLSYTHDPRVVSYGIEAAQALGVDPDSVFKTLVVRAQDSDTTGLAVGLVPVQSQLSLKAMAAVLSVKRVLMADRPSVERVSGYVLGGVSPLGMKRQLTTVIDQSARDRGRIYVSAGRRGFDLGLAPVDLANVLGATFAAIAS